MKEYFNRKPTTVKVGLKYGFVSAILLCILFVVLFYTGVHPLLIPVIYDVRIFLLALFIFFSIKEFRDNKNEGVVHFWQGMLLGLLVAIVLGFFAAIFILAFGAFEEEFLSSYISYMTEHLVSNKEKFLESIGEQTYQNTLQSLPATSLTDLAMDYYFKSVVIGLFLTIIISIILRRQPKQIDQL
ncbi:MAG: DUF4199 domain-containing protein [Candidatus Cyclobacteriaceae bacterium M2_1C_046]